MKRASKESPSTGSDLVKKEISWLLLLTFAATVFVLVTESYDSTILKAPALVLGSGMLLLVVILQWKDRPGLHPTWLHAAFVFLLLAGGVSLAGAAQLRNGLWALLTLSSLLLLFVFSAEAFRDQRNEALFHIGLVGICFVTSVVGCVQTYLTTPSVLFLTSGNQIVMSTIGNTSYYAGFLVLVIPVILGIAIANRNRPALGPVSFALLLVMLFLLVKTESRSSWLALAVAVPLFFLLAARAPRKGWIYAGAALGLLLAIGLLFPDVVQRRISALFESSGTSSFERRMYFYAGAWRAFLASPVIGNGIGNFLLFLPKFRAPDYWIAKSEDIVPHAHNEYLELMSETGILGILAFGAFVFLYVRYVRKALPGLSGPGRFILAGYSAGLAAVLIDNCASMNLRTIPVAAGFWLIAGASVGYLRPPALPVSWRIPAWVAPLRFVLLVAILAASPFYLLHVGHRYAAEKIYMEGLMLRFAGNTQAATVKFEETLSADSLHQEAGLYLLSNLVEKEEYRQAADLSESLLRRYPYAPKAHLLRAVALFELGLKDEAESEIRRELAIAGYPQGYYYAAYFAGMRGKRDEERSYLFTQLEECIRNGRSDYVREGLGKLSDVCSAALKDSCLGILRGASAAFPAEREILKMAMRKFLELGAPEDARGLGERSMSAGVLSEEEYQAIFSGSPGGTQ